MTLPLEGAGGGQNRLKASNNPAQRQRLGLYYTRHSGLRPERAAYLFQPVRNFYMPGLQPFHNCGCIPVPRRCHWAGLWLAFSLNPQSLRFIGGYSQSVLRSFNPNDLLLCLLLLQCVRCTSNLKPTQYDSSAKKVAQKFGIKFKNQ